MFPVQKAGILHQLQSDILRLQGFIGANNSLVDAGLGPIKHAFPDSSFPLGAIHEFLTEKLEDAAATTGFISGLLSTLMGNNGITFWISATRKIFPPALRNFGVQPDRFVFIDLKKEKDILWVMEEALKCGALTCVVGELRDMSFTASRRLQLAVEQSQVTGFVIRQNINKVNTTACVSRWKITSIPSAGVEGLPGIAFPGWKAELLRVRNGRPGTWDILWSGGKFVAHDISDSPEQNDLQVTKTQKAG